MQGPAIDVTAAQQVVICNTGQTLADAYAGNNRRVLTAGSALSSLTFTGAAVTDYCSSSRFQVIGKTVVYAFEAAPARTLWRFSDCTIQSAQLSTIAALTANCTVKSALATSVDSVSFNYVANALPSLGVLTAVSYTHLDVYKRQVTTCLTRRAGSKRSSCPTSTGCSTPSTD